MKKQKVPKILIVLLIILLLVFLVSAVMVVTQLVRDKHEESAFEELASRVHRSSSDATVTAEFVESVGEEPTSVGGQSSQAPDAQQPSGEIAPSAETEPESAAEQGAVTSDAQQNSRPIIQPATEAASESKHADRIPLPMYAELLKENPDMFGWISIDDTKIDYPVMYTPSDPQYYLHRAFDHSYSYSGTPFLSGECYEGCGNYIVYGHHMKNQTMFGSLSRYASRSHWEKHKIIRFDTVYASGSYEVVAAFNARVYGDDERDVFRYYDYTDVTDEARFDEFMAGVHAAQMYDTGVDVNFGDELLTLITCNYQVDDGRFVLVARRVQ